MNEPQRAQRAQREEQEEEKDYHGLHGFQDYTDERRDGSQKNGGQRESLILASESV
jgi:hypothetical protein